MTTRKWGRLCKYDDLVENFAGTNRVIDSPVLLGYVCLFVGLIWNAPVI